MDDFDIDNIDFEAAEQAALAKAEQKDQVETEHYANLDEGDGCEGGACKI